METTIGGGMRIGVNYGQQQVELEIAEGNWLPLHRVRAAEALADPGEAVRQALEEPYHFPALRRALTPDDHITIIVDEQVPQLPRLLTPILDHLVEAQVAPEAVTLLCLPPSTSQPWLLDLPERFEEVRVEVHDPADRKKLSYLATTTAGRRLYLSRAAVDADQLVVLTRRSYDPLLGYGGAETALYPALGDEGMRAALQGPLSLLAPGTKPWPLHKEAEEVAWLLGVPFFVQVIEGPGDTVAQVLGGSLDSSAEGQRSLNARWRVEVDEPADVVVASISSASRHQDLTDLARALANAARVVKRQGKIVLLTDRLPELGEAAAVLQQSGSGKQALRAAQQNLQERETLFFWASAAQQATIYLLSRLPGETAEDLLTVPLEHAGEVQRLLTGERSCLVLPEAHKMMAVLRNGSAREKI